jgi:two-component system NtrC family sensor kinase
MCPQRKTNQQLLMELGALRERNEELEAFAIERQLVRVGFQGSNELLQKILEAIPDLFAFIDSDFHILLSNWHGGYEYVPEEVRKGTPICYKAYYNRDAPCEGCHVTEVFKTGKPVIYEKMNPNIGYVEISAFPLFDESGDIVLVTENIRDISKRKQAEAALLNNEQKLKAVVYGSPIPQFVIGRDHRVVYWNKALEAITGINASEVIGTDHHWRAFYDVKRPTLADLVLDGDIGTISELFHEKFSRSNLVEDAYEVTDFFPALDVNGKWLFFTAVATRGLDGEVIGAMETLEDITERKQAEQLNSHLASIVGSSDDAIISKTLEGVITSWNAGAEKIYGYSADEAVGRPITILVPPDQADEIPRFLERVAQGHSVAHYETMRIRKDGERIYVSLSMSPIKDKNGSITEVSIIARDITERKRAEEELQRANTYNRRLIEASLDPLVTIGPEGWIADVNAATEEVTGCCRDELVGSDFSNYFTNRESARSGYQKVFRDGLVRDYPLEIRHRDGSTTPVLYNASVYRDKDGNVIGVFAAARDISEQKRAEEERKKLETQLQLAQKMEAIGTLAGGIAHDFNNILTAIVGYGYMAKMSMGPDDPHRENIELMLEGADRAAHLTKDLLIFSRKEVSEKMPVDLNEIVGIVEKFLARIIGEDIVCNMSLHGEPIVVYADTHQLEQVLMNLATNARDAMPQGGELKIGTEQTSIGDDFVTSFGYGMPGKYALLTISDTGAGMDENTRRKIFEPFFTTKEVGKGTGLGLAVVYGIIKQHDGYINVYSKPGIGTTFKIYLPLITSEVREVEIAPEEEVLTKGSETILLTEDDESVRSLISIVLKREGYTVIEAVDGKDAVKKFMENRETIQLLISDLIMPNMNGQEAYNEMKVWRPGLKAIFASGYAPDDIREKTRLECGTLLISKPISPKVLLRKVRSVLDEGEE